MSKLDLVPKKKRLNVAIIAVALIEIIVGAASSYCLSSASATPTMSSLAGTYSSTTGYTIVLYENGTGLFSSYSGTWSIVNATTFEGTYRIVSVHTDDFTITDNGFIAAGTGNVYVKVTSASPTPTESPTVPSSSHQLYCIAFSDLDSARVQQCIARFNRDYDSSRNLHSCFSSKESEKNDLVNRHFDKQQEN